MLFPESARRAIAQTFYDKTVEVLEVKKTFDPEGGVVEGISKKAEFAGNVNLSVLAKILEANGAKVDASVAITAETSAPVEIGDRLRIGQLTFEAVEVKRYDSHALILGKTL